VLLYRYTLTFLLVVVFSSGTWAISLDARETDIAEVLQQLSAQAEFDIVVGPGVKGKVTLFLSDVTMGQALEALAASGGWAVYMEGGIYRFITQDAYERRTGKRFGDEMSREVFSFRNASAQIVATSLSALSSPGGKIVVEQESNTVVVFDRRHVIDQMREVVSETDRSFDTIFVEVNWINPEEAAKQAKSLLGPSGTAVGDIRRSRVVLRDQAWRLQRAADMIQVMDTPIQREPTYIELSYETPDSIPDLLERLEKSQPGRKLTRVGDHGLLVEDSPQGAEGVVDLLSRIDKPGTTVRIDTKILQVSMSKEISTGIDWQVVGERLDDLTIDAAFPMADAGSKLDIQVGDVSDDNYEVLFSMLETFGEVELISRPSLSALSGSIAELVVGTRVPYLTVDTREDAIGVVNRYQRVIYVQVGLSMWIRPFYHNDGHITLKIRPEISSVTGYVDAGETQVPIVETTNADITATVSIGKTVVLGGLIRESKSKTSSGIPVLRSIPLLGALFRHQVDKVTRAELVILLTPTIMEPGTTEVLAR